MVTNLLKWIRSWDLPILRRVLPLVMEEPPEPISKEESKELKDIIERAKIGSDFAVRQLAYIKMRARQKDAGYVRLQNEIERIIQEGSDGH